MAHVLFGIGLIVGGIGWAILTVFAGSMSTTGRMPAGLSSNFLLAAVAVAAGVIVIWWP